MVTLGTPVTGFDAGWLLSFRREEPSGAPSAQPPVEFSCDDYYADIRATLANGLEGGTYTLVIEGVTDDDYRRLSLAQKGALDVRLHLYWRDAIDPGSAFLSNLAAYGANLIGAGGTHPSRADALPDTTFVADLRATAVTRRAGQRRYEVQVTARERIYDQLANSVIGDADIPETWDGLVQRLLSHAGLVLDDDYRFYTPKTPAPEVPPMHAGDTVLSAMQALGGKLEDADGGKYGRRMFLIRDGLLHVGARSIPLAGDDAPPIALDESGGLLEIATTGTVVVDPNFDRAANPGEQSETRRQFRVLCKGRPDVKPGDVVSFRPPEEDAADTAPPLGGGIVGAVAAFAGSQAGTPPPEVQMYVESVEHKLSRTDAFVSTITGVELQPNVPRWDVHTIYQPGSPRRNGASTSAGVEQAVVEAARRAIDRAIGARKFADIGEVRNFRPADSLTPAQTVTTFEGLSVPAGSPDGGARQAGRLEVARPSPSPARGVPYLTPFAWGPCGLLLPQYPGARVMLEHRNGQPDDPVVIGAMWQGGHGPQHGQPGDWWLILPVGAPTKSLEDSRDPAPAFSGKGTNDLTDADGNRAVEAQTFVVRAGDLQPAGTRPAVLSGDTALQLVQKTGSNTTTVTFKTDGSLEISTSKGISIDAKDDISITTAKDLNIHAQNVNVKVGTRMDVSNG